MKQESGPVTWLAKKHYRESKANGRTYCQMDTTESKSEVPLWGEESIPGTESGIE